MSKNTEFGQAALDGAVKRGNLALGKDCLKEVPPIEFAGKLIGREHKLSMMLNRIAKDGEIIVSDQLDLLTLAHRLANYDIADMNELTDALKAWKHINRHKGV